MMISLLFAVYLWGLVSANDFCPRNRNDRVHCFAFGYRPFCERRGCHWCPDMKPRCIQPSVCAAREKENCWRGKSGKENLYDCKRLDGCSWCANSVIKCARVASPSLPTPQTVVSGNCQQSRHQKVICLAWGSPSLCVKKGCWWCPNSKRRCTRGIGCSISPRINCWGGRPGKENPRDCKVVYGCSWCPYGTPKCVRDTATNPTTRMTTTQSSMTTAVQRVFTTMSPVVNNTALEITPGLPSQSTTTPIGLCPVGQVLRYKQNTCCVQHARIIGGITSSEGQWPWMGAYMIAGEHACGAVLVDPMHVITAAHCMVAGTRSTQIKFGTIDKHDESNKTQLIDVEFPPTLHEDFVSTSLNKDILLLRLKQHVYVNDYVKPVNLPRGEKVPVGTRCFVTGWGRTFFDAPTSSQHLLEVGVDILPFENCATAYANLSNVEMREKEMLCVGRVGGNYDSCQGDSGGPLVCQRCSNCDWYLAGIVSFGADCGDAKFPGVYTKMVAFEQWLEEKGVVPTEEGLHSCK